MADEKRAGGGTGSSVKRAEIVAMLSLATDLGYGQPMEHVQRSCMLALRLSERLGLEEDERAAVYYVGLLACVGCFADAHEQARWFGDDITLKADLYDVDFAGLPMMTFMMGHVGTGLSAPRRAGRMAAFMAGGRGEVDGMYVTHCFVAGMLADRLGLPLPVRLTPGSAGRSRCSSVVVVCRRRLRSRAHGAPASLIHVSSICSARMRNTCSRRSPQRPVGTRSFRLSLASPGCCPPPSSTMRSRRLPTTPI